MITGRMAQLYIVSRLWKVKPQFAVEQRTRLLRMLRTWWGCHHSASGQACSSKNNAELLTKWTRTIWPLKRVLDEAETGLSRPSS